jgi:outer membrane protein
MNNTLKTTAKTTLSLLVAFSIFSAPSLAQSATLSLEGAIKQAITQGPDVASSKTTLENARADLQAKEADPSSLVLQLTQARQSVNLNSAQYTAKRLEVAQSVTSAFANLFEAQENLKVLEAQVGLDLRSLEIAKTKLAAKNSTVLDVSKAESTLASSRQSVIDAKANIPILSNRLEVLLGVQVKGNLSVIATPAFKERKVELATLEGGLDKRLTSVVQPAQTVALNELNVMLYDNDYTAPSTLRDAKNTLENSKRNLDTAKTNALTSLRDAHRSLLNSLERVKIAKVDLANSEDDLSQSQTKFKNGTIPKNELQQNEVSTLRSRYSLLQASNTYLKALFSLSSSSGVDVTGFLGSDSQ